MQRPIASQQDKKMLIARHMKAGKTKGMIIARHNKSRENQSRGEPNASQAPIPSNSTTQQG